MNALYIHIPFCLRKCHYCDFASYPGREDAWEAYFRALEDELKSWINAVGNEFSTAFIGGGTPSLVPAEYIARIASMVRAREFSMEANPGTLTADKLKRYLDSGINRLSLGVQSFDDGLLKRIGRIHDAAGAQAAVEMARGAGFSNINIDLMYALPGQSMAQWESTLARAADIAPEHISAYSLIIEEGTPIAKWARDMDEDLVNAMQRRATAFLGEKGYARYEISNYAKPGYECAHNITYWQRGDYIGIGCAAHSLYQSRRFSNPASLDEYLAGKRKVDETLLTAEDVRDETVMLGLRMTKGVSVSALPDAKKAAGLVKMGLAEIKDDRFFLNERGLELQNAAVLELLD
jgi:oxygen-independent coproporphyrinogen-3 oxidase